MEPTPEVQPRRRVPLILNLPLFVLLLLKVVLRKTLLLFVLGLQGIFRHKYSAALVGVLLVALVWSNARVPAVSTSSAAAASALPASGGASITPASAVLDYLKGQRDGDASLMWGAMSDQFLQNLTSQGGSRGGLQQQLDSAKAQGRRVSDTKYVAGFKLDSGESIFVFVVTMEQGGQRAQVPYMFTVGPQGRIESID